MNKIVTIPNLISAFRLLLISAIAVSYIWDHYVLAAGLIVLSGLSDLADGMIARHFHMISNLGKVLDPLADKLTMAVVVFCLMLQHPPIRLVLGVLVAKELLMLIGTLVLFKAGKRPCESKIWGKLATTLLYIVMLTVVVSDCARTVWGVSVPPSVVWVLSGFACALMIMALLQYYPIFRGIFSGKYKLETERFE